MAKVDKGEVESHLTRARSHLRAIFEPDQCWITSYGILRTEAVVDRAVNLRYDQGWRDVQFGEWMTRTVAKINPGVLDICLASS